LALLSAETPVNGLATYPKRVPSGDIMGQPPVSPIWDRFDFTDARLSRSKALYEQNLILLDESRRLIAVSRRLLNRAWEFGPRPPHGPTPVRAPAVTGSRIVTKGDSPV